MSGQPAWARYGRLQGALMATAPSTADIVARWAAEGDGREGNAPSVPQVPQVPEGDAPAVDAPEGSGPEVGKQFVLGGNAIVTLAGASTRYTFRVQQGKPREGDAPDRTQPYFLQLLTGPDNTADYQYVGIVDQSSGRVRLTRASRLTAASAPVAAWDWVMTRMFAGKAYAPATVHHAGRCGRCGRLLTVPTSIESGFGPECSAKLGI